MEKQFREHTVEPNSALGQVIRYMQNHCAKLKLYLRKARIPLDTNIAERGLKRVILHWKRFTVV
jgi:hypothetical protein